LRLHPVVLAGAGIGNADNTSQGTINAIKACDVCIHDALLPAELLAHLPPAALAIPVGKRLGKHSVKQAEICSLLLEYARKGRRIVRLKGGDPTVFGRLAEEVDALQEAKLSFRVLPGLGSYSVAAASTGILPSRRGLARGFSIMTPRKSGSSEFEPVTPEERLRFPQIFYMGASVVPQMAEQ